MQIYGHDKWGVSTYSGNVAWINNYILPTIGDTKNAELMENAFYNKENLNPQMKEQDEDSSTITVPDGVDAELLMKVLRNPEMAALLNSLAKTMKV